MCRAAIWAGGAAVWTATAHATGPLRWSDGFERREVPRERSAPQELERAGIRHAPEVLVECFVEYALIEAGLGGGASEECHRRAELEVIRSSEDLGCAAPLHGV